MEAKEKRNEVLLLVIALLPIVYFAAIWNSLPAVIPTHYNIHMQPDDHGSKAGVFSMIVLLNTGFYLLMKYIYKIDPKRKITKGSRIYIIMRFITGIMIAVISMLIVLMSQQQAFATIGMKILVLVIGALFMVLGNYLPVVKQNYFIGIRTPWTLDNEVVWTRTHRLGGRLFMIGGVLIVAGAFFSSIVISFVVLMTVALGVAAFTILYSYLQFRKEKHEHI